MRAIRGIWMAGVLAAGCAGGPATLAPFPQAPPDGAPPPASAAAEDPAAPVPEARESEGLLRWQVWAIAGTRTVTGGDAQEPGEKSWIPASSGFAGLGGGPLIPLGQSMALIPYVTGHFSTFESWFDDFLWEISSVGGGARCSIVHSNTFDLYGFGEAEFTHWEIRERDEVLPEELKDLDGVTLSLGMGGDLLPGESAGVGMQVAYRYFGMTREHDARWVDLGVTFTYRF